MRRGSSPPTSAHWPISPSGRPSSPRTTSASSATEVTGFCLFGGYGGRGAGNAGRPAPVTAVRILGEDGRECPVGEAGEVCVRGGTVHLGYWNRPEINEQRFRGGWWHTTDLGRREADGTITFLGTMTRMIKSGAENIFPAEVETCLEAHPAVKEAAVIGVPSERFLQDVKAVVVLNGTDPVTAAELIEYCRRNVASYRSRRRWSSWTRCRASAAPRTTRRWTRSSAAAGIPAATISAPGTEPAR
jgi:acyl-CoA synthetase (AMP-forming)/AMP-acid ligase II